MVQEFIKEVLTRETSKRKKSRETKTREGKKQGKEGISGKESALVGLCGGTLGCEIHLSLLRTH